MADREKVIQHFSDCCDIAEENGNGWVFVRTDVLYEAIDLLKAQEPRVLTREEVFGDKIVEAKYEAAEDGSFPAGITLKTATFNGLVDVQGYDSKDGLTVCAEFSDDPMDEDMVVWRPVDDYGKTWRCWSARPTDEQREAVKWDRIVSLM